LGGETYHQEYNASKCEVKVTGEERGWVERS
jgi:hypothetical protein